MHPLRSISLLALLTLGCLTFAFARTTYEGKVKFPIGGPTFSIELPAGWTCQPDDDENLDCKSGKDETYQLTIMPLPDVKSEKALRSTLPKLAKSMADAAKMKDFELGDIESDKNGHDVSFIGLRGDGKTEGIDFVVMVHAFEIAKGEYFVIVTAGSKESDDKYEDAYEEITASIEPL